MLTSEQFQNATDTIFNKASKIIDLEQDKKDSSTVYPMEQQQQLYNSLVRDLARLQYLCIDLGKTIASLPSSNSQ